MSETTEAESIERMIDATRSAVGFIDGMCRRIAGGSAVRPTAMVDLLRCLNIAAGACGQLVHQQQNPEFMVLRTALEQSVKTLARFVPHPTPDRGLMLAKYGAVLDRIWREAKRISESRAMPRQDVLAVLDRRAAAVH